MATTKRLTAAEAEVGMRAAYEGALEVLRDPKAAPTSKASASSTMIKIVEAVQKGDTDAKDPSDMTYDELQEAIDRSRRQLGGLDDELDQPEAKEAGVFD